MSGTPPGAGPQDTGNGGEDVTKEVTGKWSHVQSGAGPLGKDKKVKIKVTRKGKKG